MSANTNPATGNTNGDDSGVTTADFAADFYIEDAVALEQFICSPGIYSLAAYVLKRVIDDNPDYEPHDLTDFCGWHLARRRFLIGPHNKDLIDTSPPYCPSIRSGMHAVPIIVLFETMEELRIYEGFASFGTPSQAWRAYYATFKAYLSLGQPWVVDPFSELPIVQDYLIDGSLVVEWTDAKKEKLKRSVEAVIAYQKWFCGPEEYDVNETLRDTIRRSRDSIARELDNRIVKEIEE